MSEPGRYGVIKCRRCGEETPRNAYAQKYCPECRKIVKREKDHSSYVKYKDNWYSKPKAEEQEELTEEYVPPKRKAQKKPKLTIAQVTALARAAGMSYGQYVSKTERR